jgi:hypothetical protein
MNGILGMRAGEARTFDVDFSTGDAFNNESDELFGKDLVYRVYIKEILLDVTEPPFSILDIPFIIPFSLLFAILILAFIFQRTDAYSKFQTYLGRNPVCFSCNSVATVKCGNPNCNTLFCKECFIKENHCSVCKSNKMLPLHTPKEKFT